MIRVVLPPHLKGLAHVSGEVQVDVTGPATQRSVVDALERSIRCSVGRSATMSRNQRRPFLRFFACEEDLSHESPDAPLPDDVVSARSRCSLWGRLRAGEAAVMRIFYKSELARQTSFLEQ